MFKLLLVRVIVCDASPATLPVPDEALGLSEKMQIMVGKGVAFDAGVLAGDDLYQVVGIYEDGTEKFLAGSNYWPDDEKGDNGD